MTHQRLSILAASLISVGALAASSLLAVTTADAHPQSRPTAARAAMAFTAGSVDADHALTFPSHLRPGLRTIKITTTQKDEVSFWRPKAGYTVEQMVNDANAAFGPETDLTALNRIYNNVVIYGGIVSGPNHPGVMLLNLPVGHYFAVVLPAGPFTADILNPLTVSGDPTGSTATYPNTLTATTDMWWDRSPSSIPSKGLLKFKNTAKSWHFVEIDRLAPGKTYADFKKWINDLMHGKNGPPPLTSYSYGQGVVSPGHAYGFKYDIPPGKYVVMCWMPDRETGMPHVFMGMSRPLTVK